MDKKKTYIDIIIDKLTHSIENSISGDVFDTEIILMTSKNKRQIKKAEWLFDWNREIDKSDRQVFRLVIRNNENVIQGLISISDYKDHIYLHAFNRELKI
jgi:hypothetical protein